MQISWTKQSSIFRFSSCLCFLSPLSQYSSNRGSGRVVIILSQRIKYERMCRRLLKEVNIRDPCVWKTWACVCMCILFVCRFYSFSLPKWQCFARSPLKPKTSISMQRCVMLQVFVLCLCWRILAALALWFQNKPFFSQREIHEFQANVCISHWTSDWVFSVLLHWTPASTRSDATQDPVHL